MRALLLSFAILLSGCGTMQTSSYIDPEFTPYYDAYANYKKELTGKRTYRIGMSFRTLEDPTIGVCQWYKSGRRQIYIDPNFWFNSSDADRELLVFHELGHCELGRGHVEPSSVMEKWHLGGPLYTLYKDYFVGELFETTERVNLFSNTTAKMHTHDALDTCGGIEEINDVEDKHEINR